MSDLQNRRNLFYRQGSWMVMATTVSGFFMALAHIFGAWMSSEEYGLMATLFQGLYLLLIPALGMQTVLAQQSASVVTEQDQWQLNRTIQVLMKVSTLCWLGGMVLVWGFQNELGEAFSVRQPAALYLTAVIGWLQILFTVFLGVMQGTQRFGWMGGVLLANGLGRFVAMGIFVVGFGAQALGGVSAALSGFLLAGILIGWNFREGFPCPKGIEFDWKSFVSRLVPLTLGLGVSQFLLAADMVAVRLWFPEAETGPYGGAGALARGLVMFTAPILWVMFPKIASSHARSEKSDIFLPAFLTTAGCVALLALGITGAAWLAPEVLNGIREWLGNEGGGGRMKDLANRILEKEEKIVLMTQLLPGLVWAIAPLALGNVILNNLLARKQYAMLPGLVVIALGYGVSLLMFHQTYRQVIGALGVANLIFCLTNIAYVLRKPEKTPEMEQETLS